MRSPWPFGPRPVCRSIQASCCSACRGRAAPGGASSGSRSARRRRRRGRADGGTGRPRSPPASALAPRSATKRGGGVDRRRIRRPGRGHDQRRDLVVGGVARRLGDEVAEVAVQVDVLVRRAPPPGEAPGIEAVDVEHGDAGVGRGPVPVGVFEQGDLHARAAEALDAVAGAADDEQRPGVARPVAGDVHRQHLAVAAGQRMDVGLDPEAADPGGGEELVARFGIALREETGLALMRAPQRFGASQASARRTQSEPPSGISSSLKS